MQIQTMKRVANIGIFSLALWFVGGIGVAGAFVKSGSVDGFTFDQASVSSLEPDLHAGANATLLSKIGGIGDSVVSFSASWDWNTYSADYSCALVETVGHDFTTDLIPTSPTYLMAWSSTAMVTITHKSGAVITADITGGSVCEITVFGPGMSINEWNINFKVNGGTKRFMGATGTGTIHFFFDSRDFTFGINEVLVHID